MLKNLKNIKKRYDWGGKFLTNKYQEDGILKTNLERVKTPSKTEIINFLLNNLNGTEKKYLEIGVRNPNDNFNHIKAKYKYSVDPGIEFKENPVDFKLTSDEFFYALDKGNLLNQSIRFDIIFIDGAHLAEQVKKDIENALRYLNEDGFIILHDCNPPTEWHARHEYDYHLSPAGEFWSGSTWKAFVQVRKRTDISACCIDTDWGVGIISKSINLGPSNRVKNDFFEYHIFNQYRTESLNLITFDKLQLILSENK